MLETQREFFIDAPWGKICIVSWGFSADPPVLLCHGTLSSNVTWLPLIKHLPRAFYYIGMELPGNGKSDHYPKGVTLSPQDFVYSMEVVRKHFKWDHFMFMAHSAGAELGRLHALAYPGRITKIVELDPNPTYYTYTPQQYKQWYFDLYASRYEKYRIINSPNNKQPLHTRKKGLLKLGAERHLSDKLASMMLDRISVPARDGFIRYTYDQRQKKLLRPPHTAEQLKSLYTSIKTPILVIAASESVAQGYYVLTPFAFDEKCYPHNNYRVVHVTGSHGVHAGHPERVATFVGRFLLYGVEGLDNKSKL